MTAALLRNLLAVTVLASMASGAAALDCKRAHSRIERTICTVPGLRQQDAAMDKAYGEALKRAGAKAGGLRAAQQGWLSDREAACATSDRKVLERCLGAQYRFRLQMLGSVAPAASAAPPNPAPPPAAAAAPPPSRVAAPTAAPRAPKAAPLQPAAAGLHPGTYLSDAVEFVLGADGSFSLRELGGSRRAAGHYRYADGTLTLSDATGDVGRTVFPLQCRVLQTANGFAVTLGQSQCRPFDGLSFRMAD